MYLSGNPINIKNDDITQYYLGSGIVSDRCLSLKDDRKPEISRINYFQ